MHEIRVTYCDYEICRHGGEEGYHVEVNCSLVHSSKLLAVLKDPADALKYANWKATEMGLSLDLGWKLEKALGIAKKEIKKSKKKKKEKKK